MSTRRLEVWFNWRKWGWFVETWHTDAHLFMAVGPLWILVKK
jgi:hypothetical protein